MSGSCRNAFIVLLLIGLPDPVKEDAQGPLHKGRAGQYSFGEAGVRNNFQGAGIEPDWDRLHLVKVCTVLAFYLRFCNTLRNYLCLSGAGVLQ